MRSGPDQGDEHIRLPVAVAVLSVTVLLPGTAQAREHHSHRDLCWRSSCRERVEHKRFVHLQRMLPRSTKQMLAGLRGCETRGIPFPMNYRNAGHHFGAYQYSWGPGSAGERAGFKKRPDLVPPSEQDVRTARWFPSHRGEWACKV